MRPRFFTALPLVLLFAACSPTSPGTTLPASADAPEVVRAELEARIASQPLADLVNEPDPARRAALLEARAADLDRLVDLDRNGDATVRERALLLLDETLVALASLREGTPELREVLIRRFVVATATDDPPRARTLALELGTGFALDTLPARVLLELADAADEGQFAGNPRDLFAAVAAAPDSYPGIAAYAEYRGAWSDRNAGADERALEGFLRALAWARASGPNGEPLARSISLDLPSVVAAARGPGFAPDDALALFRAAGIDEALLGGLLQTMGDAFDEAGSWAAGAAYHRAAIPLLGSEDERCEARLALAHDLLRVGTSRADVEAALASCGTDAERYALLEPATRPRPTGAVPEGLDPAIIRRIVRTRMAGVLACFREAERRHATFRPPETRVEWSEHGEGTIVRTTSSGDPACDRCVDRALTSIRFPATDLPPPLRMTPFNFSLSLDDDPEP